MSFFEKASLLEKEGSPFVVITLTGGKGHVPQIFGAKVLVTAEAGLVFGTVGGGKVEAAAIELGVQMLKGQEKAPRLVSWNLQRDLDMTCGGEMSFLLEPFYPSSWQVVLYGAGHVGQALTRVLDGMNCRITVVEARAEWREKLPKSPKVRAFSWAEPARELAALPAHAFHVVVTQDHECDRPILEAISRHFPHAPYVGVIGSATKAGKMRRELKELGAGDEFLERLRCPIGLAIGGNEPGEIAVSIAAELLKVRDENIE